jgi:RP/EB family microtubule-associated protein
MVENYKILQEAFKKNGITQYVDVPTLCKGKYMASLEMFQWIHGYFEQMSASMSYDGVGRRRQTRCRDPNDRGRPAAKPAGMAKRQAGVPLKAPDLEVGRREVVPAGRPGKREAGKAEGEAPEVEVGRRGAALARRPAKPEVAKSVGSGDGNAESAELRKRAGELEHEVEQMTQERDFYYAKLRRIEDYCQENEEQEIVQQVLEILYEPDHEHGFLPPEEEQD